VSGAQVCFLYYTGHAKKGAPEGDDEHTEGNVIANLGGEDGGDWGGAWVLSKASIEEYPNQTIADIYTLTDLLDAWEVLPHNLD